MTDSSPTAPTSRASEVATRVVRLVDDGLDRMATLLDRQTVREFLAEFLGTFILMAFGDAALANYVLRKELRHNPQAVDILAVCLCWGVGAMIGITASAPVSGGHINPAVTVALAVLKRHPWTKVPHYLAGQYLGSFTAAAVVYICHFDALNNFDGGTRVAYAADYATGHIFSTYPNYFVSLCGSFFDQVIGTMMLMLSVLAVTDTRGLKVPTWLQPVFLCFVICVLCTAFGLNCMAVLNPARDFAPRLFCLIAGWGWSTFYPLGGHYWWVAGILGPHVGAILGGWIYLLTIDHENLSCRRSRSADKNELRAVRTGSPVNDGEDGPINKQESA